MKAERPYPAYTVTPKAEAAILKGHPWVYADEITAAPDTAPENGAVVDVLSRKGVPGQRPAQRGQQDTGAAFEPQRQRPL